MLPVNSYFVSKVYAGMLPGDGLGQGPSWTSKECGGASLQNRVFEHFLHLFVLFIRIWRKSCNSMHFAYTWELSGCSADVLAINSNLLPPNKMMLAMVRFMIVLRSIVAREPWGPLTLY